MARGSSVENQVPANGAESIPYADHQKLNNGYLKHMAEAVLLEGDGAGGVGVTFANVPFEPGYMRISEATGPLLQEQFHTENGVTGIDCLLGTAAAADVTVTDNGDGTFDIVVPTGVAPDGDTVSIVMFGVRTSGIGV